MTVENEINEIGEEPDINETKLVDNVTPKLEEFGESSKRNAYFMRSRYVPVRHTNNFFFGFIHRKTTTFEEIGLIPIRQI